jgi:hypothetical protein
MAAVSQATCLRMIGWRFGWGEKRKDWRMKMLKQIGGPGWGGWKATILCHFVSVYAFYDLYDFFAFSG